MFNYGRKFQGCVYTQEGGSEAERETHGAGVESPPWFFVYKLVSNIVLVKAGLSHLDLWMHWGLGEGP